MLLQDKTVIITGASSGIGAAAARLFAAQGARLVLGARRLPELQAVADEICHAGGTAVPLAGDVTDPHYAGAMVDLAKQEFGGLDAAFNNAGRLGSGAKIAETEPEEWEEVLATNLTAAFHAARAEIPALLARGGGSLIFTGTFIGHTATLPGMGTYAASKSGLIGLVQAIAVDYGPQGISCQCLAARRHPDRHGRRCGDQPTNRHLYREPSCAEADGATDRDRQCGAVPRL